MTTSNNEAVIAERDYKEFRNLSGIFFREKVGSSWKNVCFEELSEEGQDRILNSKNPEFVKNLAKMLGNTIRELGDKFDILTEQI